MTRLRLLAAAAVFLACTFLVLPMDVAVAQYLGGKKNLPGDIKRLVSLCEVFAHGLGVAMILITALVLDWKNRRRIALSGVCAYGCGGLANLAKMVVGRSRPHSTDLASSTSYSSFGDWFPAWSGESWTHAMQSFPSAHTATGVGFAVGLSLAYPQGRVWFGVLAGLAAFQRMECGAHYFSDVMAGATMAFLITGLLIPFGKIDCDKPPKSID